MFGHSRALVIAIDMPCQAKRLTLRTSARTFGFLLDEFACRCRCAPARVASSDAGMLTCGDLASAASTQRARLSRAEKACKGSARSHKLANQMCSSA